jgi:WD40-like Beta Propeller Repeat
VTGREFSVSNDGTLVFRAVADQDGLWKVGRDGQRPIELAKGSVSYPFISADGRRVVFSSRLGGPQTVWQVPTDGGPATQVVDGVVASTRSRTSHSMANP